MTKHVRTTYRRHRKATWGLALALAVAIAAVAIPIASGTIANGGDSDKTYTLGFAPGSTLSKTLCTSDGNVVLTLTNTARSTTLGSADITFPGFAKVASTGLATSKGTISLDSTKNKIKLRSLGLGKNEAATITVSFSSLSPGGPAKLVTVVKKTSTFSGDDDDFRSAPAPTLTVMGCATISGQVFNDRNGNLVFDSGTPGDAGLAWDVSLYKKVGSTYQFDRKVTAGSGGNYTFTGAQAGKDYRICVKATGTDTGKAWALEKPTGNSNCPNKISDPSDPNPAALELPALAGSVTGQDFAVVQVTAPVACGGQSGLADYLVQLGNDAAQPTSTANCDKATARYVQDSFTNAGTRYFLFSPAPGAGSGEVLLVEELKSTFDLSKGQSTVLKYDDVAPYFDNLVEMPLCVTDPRQNPSTDKLLLKPNLDKSGVLPGSATSCLITYRIDLGPAAGTFTRTDYVFTAVDGSRGVG